MLLAWLITIGLVRGVLAAPAIPDSLTLQSDGRQVSYTLAELKRRIPTIEVQVSDPVYATPRKWDAFRLEDVLRLLEAESKAADEIVFQSADGYAPSIASSKLLGHRAFLAYQEHGRKDRFEKIRQGKAVISPAPFYLLWEAGKSVGEDFPWPYQLVKIELVSFRKKYAKIYPDDTHPGSDSMKGFLLFKTLCIRCHSINLIGGDIGPELNIPKNVLEYWNEKTLREFVKNAPSFRARSKMPPFTQLSDEDIDKIFAYFKWAKAHKRPETP